MVWHLVTSQPVVDPIGQCLFLVARAIQKMVCSRRSLFDADAAAPFKETIFIEMLRVYPARRLCCCCKQLSLVVVVVAAAAPGSLVVSTVIIPPLGPAAPPRGSPWPLMEAGGPSGTRPPATDIDVNNTTHSIIR